jgi:hypothetical protein
MLTNACLNTNFGTKSSYLRKITTTVSECYGMAQPTCPTQPNCNGAIEKKVSKWETNNTEVGTYVFKRVRKTARNDY